jgi:hypothetical protein
MDPIQKKLVIRDAEAPGVVSKIGEGGEIQPATEELRDPSLRDWTRLSAHHDRGGLKPVVEIVQPMEEKIVIIFPFHKK